MRALVIKPIAERHEMSVCEVDIPFAPGSTEPDFLRLGALVEGFPERVRTPSITLGGHVLFVDGDGLNKIHGGFLHCPEIYPLPLAGTVIVLGEQPDSKKGPVLCDASVSVLSVLQLVRESFIDRDRARELHEHSADMSALANPDFIVLRGSFPADSRLSTP